MEDTTLESNMAHGMSTGFYQMSDGHSVTIDSTTGVFLAGLYLVMNIILATLGNSAVIIVSLRKRRKLKPVDLLTINLAMTDLLVALFSYPLPTISCFKNTWSFGRVGCVWYGFSGFFFAIASIATLTAIAVFRYIKLCREHVDANKARIYVIRVIVAVWIYSLVIAMPPLLGWSRYVLEPFELSCTVDFYDTSSAGLAYTYGILVFVFLLPLAVIIACYIAIARKLILHNNRMNVTRSVRYLLEVRLLKTACAITMAFVICWTPYTIVSIWVTIQPLRDVPKAVLIFPAFFAKSSAIYNPIIYIIFNKSFRREVGTFLCCCACQCYTITLNIDGNDHARDRLVQVQSKREDQGKVHIHPVVVCASPVALSCTWPWGAHSRASDDDQQQQHRSTLQEVNAIFSRHQDRVRFMHPLTACASYPTVPADGNLRRRRSGMNSLSAPVSDNNSSAAVAGPSAARDPMSCVMAMVERAGEDHRLQNECDLHADPVDPNAASQYVRVIVVNPNIDIDSSSD